jgi:nucleotide-binding universal stress UspA family protein
MTIDRTEPATGVLVGVDGDPATTGAVEWAAREADRRHVSLDLVQVLPGSVTVPALQEPAGRAHVLLDQARRVTESVAPGVPVRISVVEGGVGAALVQAAERAALLVIGSRGPAIDVDPTVGRTVAHVLGHALCPVIVVPRARRDDDGGAVFVGVDGSPDAVAAVDFAADVADRRQAPLVALGVAPRLGAPDHVDLWRRSVAEAVSGIAEDYPDVPVREEIRRGRPGEEIVRGASGAQLIVLGSRGRGAVTGALLGSTSQSVVSLAPCPVAVLPPRASDARSRRLRTAVGRSS